MNIECINPESIEIAKTQPRKITFLSEEEIKKILKAIDDFEQNEIIKLRDKAIILTLYGS
jgi:site-specific recombinase XerD